jgi:hypothetical protein
MMDWQIQIVTIYLDVGKHYRQGLWTYCQRMSNYADLSFTDEEVMTIYLFGVIDGRLREWFPQLPTYTAFIQRLNKVAEVFAPLLEIIITELEVNGCTNAWLVDSLPVALAKPGHRFKAKVAPELASAGYCSTQKLYYYGVRVHIVGRAQPGTLPRPEYIGVTGASHHDGQIFEHLRPYLHDNELFGDKAYQRPDAQQVKDKQGLVVRTPIKKRPGQTGLDAAAKLYSTAVSRTRQPIESLLAWIEQKSAIESASRVRSYAGLLVHVFGKLAAVMFFWIHLRMSS